VVREDARVVVVRGAVVRAAVVMEEARAAAVREEARAAAVRAARGECVSLPRS
jgi:hypothetical protein